MSRNKSLASLVAALTMVTFAFAAISAAEASAARFKYSGTGELTGKQTSDQVFAVSAGNVTCKKAHLTGAKTDTEFTAQEVNVEYSECSAFGFSSATVSVAKFDLHANGEVDILNEPKITVPLGFCSLGIPPQSGQKSVEYLNKSGKLEVLFDLVGLKFQGSGGACGAESTGSYTGSFLVELIGGTIEWEA